MRRAMTILQAITAMVQQAALYINDTPDLETRNELIETLNSISAGKVHYSPYFGQVNVNVYFCSVFSFLDNRPPCSVRIF